MTTLAELLASSRILALRGAIVARTAARYPDIEVRAHIGKLDFSDVAAMTLFAAPSINIAATRFDAEDRLSRAVDARVHLTAYIYAENGVVAGAMVKADELAIALTEALTFALSDADFTQWGVANIGAVEEARGQPLFTTTLAAKGGVYYAVTWKQPLYAMAPANFWTGGDEP